MANQNIDSLSVKITTETQGVSKSLGAIITKLQQVSDKLSSLSGNTGLTTVASEVNQLTTALKGFSAKDAKTISNISKSLNSISSANSGGITSVATSLNELSSVMGSFNAENSRPMTSLAKSLSTISNVNSQGINNVSMAIDNLGFASQTVGNVSTRSFSTLANNLTKLSKITPANLSAIATAITEMGKSLEGFQTIDGKNFSTLARNVNKFASVSPQQLTQVNTALKEIGSMMSGLNLGEGGEQLKTLTSSIATLGRKGVTDAITNIPQLSNALMQLMTTLSNAPAVSDNVVRLVSSLAQLTQGMNSFTRSSGGSGGGSGVSTACNVLKSAFSGLHNVFTKVGGAVKGLVSKIRNFSVEEEKADKTTSNFASTMGMLYARFWVVIRAFKLLTNQIKSAMSYVETLNYFDKAFGQVADSAVASFSEAGYDSAQSYYDSFKERASTLNKKLTGFFVNSQGMLESAGTASLGLNPTDTLQYQSLYAQMATSMGVASEEAMTLSTVLTELGADLASVKDMDFTDVWTDMASGLTGMSRTLDKYGVNIRNANLQLKLNELGIDAQVSSLSQADKAMLRTIVLLDSTKYAYADLATTINSSANQWRLLISNIQTMGKMLGSLFLPILQKVLPYVNGLVIAIQRLLSAVAKVLGIDLTEVTSATGDTSDTLSDILDETDDLGDSLEDADDEAKKLKNHLLGIDELNILNDTSDTSSTTSATDISDKLADALNDAYNNYQDIWDKAFAGLENKAQQIADAIEAWAKKVFQPIKDAWDAVGDYVKGAFSALASTLAKMFNAIAKDWAKVWQGDDVEKTFEALFKILGNIVTLASNLGNKFTEAWTSANTGYHILQNLASIARSIAEFGERITKSWADWANNDLDLKPLLTSVKDLTEAIADNIDDVLGILEDINKLFVQPVLTKLVNTWLPSLLDIATKIVNGIDWVGLRTNLEPLWTGLEKIAEVMGDSFLSILNKIADVVINLVNGNYISNIATSVNELGTALKNAGNLSDVINALFDFGDGRLLDATKLINALTTWINTAFDEFDISGAMTTLGTRLGEQVNLIAENLDFGAITTAISNFILGLGDVIIAFLDTVKWDEVGRAIGDALEGIDWAGLLSELWEIIKGIAKGLIEAWAGAFGESPVATTILTAIAGLFTYDKLSKTIGNLTGGSSGGGLLSQLVKKVFGLDTATETLGKTATTVGEDATASAGGFLTTLGNIATQLTVIGTLMATVFTLYNAGKDMNEYSDNIKTYGWDEGRRKNADIGANPYKNGTAITQEDDSGVYDKWMQQLRNNSGKNSKNPYENGDAITQNDNSGWLDGIREQLATWWQGLWTSDGEDGTSVLDSTVVQTGIDNTLGAVDVQTPCEEDIGTPIGDFFQQTLPEKFSGAKEAVGTKFDEIQSKFIAFKDEWSAKAKEWGSEKWEDVTNGLSSLKENVGSKWTEMRDGFSEHVSQWKDKASEWAGEKWENITTAVGTLKDNVSNDWTEMRQNFADHVTEWGGKIGEWAGESWDSVTSSVENVKSNIKEKWDGIKSNFTTHVSDWKNNISSWASAKWDSVTNKVKEVKENVDTKWGEMKENFGTFRDNWREQIGSWASDKWSNVTDKVKTVKENINTKWGEAKTNFETMRSNWRDQIGSWASDKWEKITDKVKTTKEAINTKWGETKDDFDTFKGKFGGQIESWATDKWEKITDKVEEVRGRIDDKWGEMKDNFDSFFEKWGEKIKTWSEYKWDTLVNNFETLRGKISDKWAEIKTDASARWGEFQSNIPPLARTACNDISSAFSRMKSSISNVFDSVYSIAQSCLSSIDSWVSSIFTALGNIKTSIGSIHLGGYGGMFASGGFPEDGLFFNANHGELVGKFANGKTAVANNQEITQGIANATYNAFMRATQDSGDREAQLLQELISAVKQGNTITIDGRDIVTAYDSRKERNGYSFT